MDKNEVYCDFCRRKVQGRLYILEIDTRTVEGGVRYYEESPQPRAKNWDVCPSCYKSGVWVKELGLKEIPDDPTGDRDTAPPTQVGSGVSSPPIDEQRPPLPGPLPTPSRGSWGSSWDGSGR